MRTAAIILGVAFLVLACVYWFVPAGSLPGFIPGFEANSGRIHLKHGIAALAVGIILFAIAWFMGRARSA